MLRLVKIKKKNAEKIQLKIVLWTMKPMNDEKYKMLLQLCMKLKMTKTFNNMSMNILSSEKKK